MYIPIDKMPPTSRVWIYQSNRNLNQDEVNLISDTLKNFCESWSVHGSPLQTSFSVDENRFIVLAVIEDVSAPSGCSIDSSVHVLKNLEKQINVDFLSRDQVIFYNGTEIISYPFHSLKKLFTDGILHENSITLNTLVQTLGEWKDNRKVKVSESWLKRFIPKVSLSE